MSLSRFYEPFYSLSDFDRLFDEAFSAREFGFPATSGQVAKFTGGDATKSVRPKMDLHEDEKSNTVTATFELPGLKKEDVHIDVVNDVLTISGEAKKNEDYDKDGWKVQERRFGKFTRSLQLPQGVNEGQIKAQLENGVLSVKFPKATPQQQAKKITIQ
ncbi:small heat shock protein [Abortiporus biennis]|nr:small heat shock protein [Abortiporus biennis]